MHPSFCVAQKEEVMRSGLAYKVREWNHGSHVCKSTRTNCESFSFMM